MHNLPFIGLLLACISLVTLLACKLRWSFVKDLLTVGEDQWTWITLSGEVYEDGEVRNVEAGQILLYHSRGASLVEINSLSENSRELLLRSAKWQAHISASPIQDKIATFAIEHPEEPVHATQAA